MKWQGIYERKGGGGFKLKESLEISWLRARSAPGNFIPGRRDHAVRLRAAMVSPTPQEAATPRAGRSGACLLSLSQEHNPG